MLFCSTSGWVIGAEPHGIQLFNRLAKDVENEKQKECIIFDVGMNDGFYTNYGAFHGCRVFAFELQPSCINAAITAIRLNNLQSKVRIFNHPVSSSDDVLSIPLSKDNTLCRGTFSFTRTDEGNMNDAGSVTNFTAVRLDNIVPSGYKIDMLKIDTEGHDPQVLLGAENLFKNKQIRYLAMIF